MAGAPVTEAEVRALLVGPLEVGTSVSWKLKSNDSWAEAQLAVRQPLPGATLSVRLTVNLLAPSKYSIILLLNDAHRIRSLDVGGNHQNKHTDQNRWVHQTHEHQWTDACHGAWACSVPEPADIEAAFRSFCDRVGIKFVGRWALPPTTIQLGFDDP